MAMRLIVYVRSLKKSIPSKVIAEEKSPWILRDSWIWDAIEAGGTEPGCPAEGRRPKQMPGQEKVHVAVLLAGNNRYYLQVSLWSVRSVVKHG